MGHAGGTHRPRAAGSQPARHAGHPYEVAPGLFSATGFEGSCCSGVCIRFHSFLPPVAIATLSPPLAHAPPNPSPARLQPLFSCAFFVGPVARTQVAHKLYSNRKFKDFALPVLDQPLSTEVREAYKKCVSWPMDLSMLLWEVDSQVCARARARIVFMYAFLSSTMLYNLWGCSFAMSNAIVDMCNRCNCPRMQHKYLKCKHV